MNSWPPKDWRALLALVFSVLGAMVLTVFVWWVVASLLPDKGWSAANEMHRLETTRWVVWLATGGVVVVLVGLGMAINRRSFKGNLAGSNFEFEGGDSDTPTTPADAAQATADAAVRQADAIAEQTEGEGR